MAGLCEGGYEPPGSLKSMLRHRYTLLEENGNTVAVNSERYVGILRPFLQPELRRRLREIARQIVWFQQDGASAHTAKNSMPVVRCMYPGHIISRRGDIPWPPCYRVRVLSVGLPEVESVRKQASKQPMA
ncbi:hypothetical protein ANN_21506 [Periplaneta americana]|uniref:Uncharacterized protein n=1 Tax=Periplaneta americana TaxID=6978 RepID=A0ABQ8SFG9_PERAM|nr:hypothetical protein ANN_21506 [Periplaneta americana]